MSNDYFYYALTSQDSTLDRSEKSDPDVELSNMIETTMKAKRYPKWREGFFYGLWLAGKITERQYDSLVREWTKGVDNES